ncbi:unnamed protein product, partial [Mesorhabditis belari]|uniref:Uncharacterized protein n=1 Tax=Mesorhabditis belari TaxID=2138241 RepID=A0AAF3F613_9BILA
MGRLHRLAKLLLSTAFLLVACVICHLILIASWNQSTFLLDRISIDCDAINSVNISELDNPALAKWASWKYDHVDREMAIYATSPGEARNVVDRDSHALFNETIHGLSSCFDNIHVVTSNRSIGWGGHEILTSMYDCAEYLAKQEHPWKYYQYLSGFDVPLKTNLEMVRIFRALNQTVNVEVVEPPHQTRNTRGELAPLRIYKASMSALVPRAGMNAVTKEHSAITTAVIRWLNVSPIASDELLWPTIFGNMRRLPIPGGFDARLILRKKSKRQSETNLKQRKYPRMNINVKITKSNGIIAATSRDVPVRYWLGRFQIWRNDKDEELCHGKMTHSSCVYGVGDVPNLLKRPELVAHKLYIDYQPAAFFCLLKEHQRRSMDAHNKFNASVFSSMPFVELARGVDIEHLSHSELLY